MITFTTGARQLVVQLALEMTWWLAGSYISWFTPRTTVMSSFFAGAEMMTFFAPASRWATAFSLAVKRPVDSTTTSTPSSFQGSWAGSFSAKTLRSSPSTRRPLSVTSTVPG